MIRIRETPIESASKISGTRRSTEFEGGYGIGRLVFEVQSGDLNLRGFCRHKSESSLTALPTYESRVKDKVDQLMTRFSTGKPVNVTQENTFYAWDVMGDIAFSTQFNMLR